MNKKITIIVISFLLLVPFRLPISVLFIDFITGIATLKGHLTMPILTANIVVTKLIYNIVLAAISIYNVELLTRKIYGRNPLEIGENEPTAMYYTTIISIVLYVCYIWFDTATTVQLFEHLYKINQ